MEGTENKARTYGLEIDRTYYTPFRSVMQGPETTPNGNVVLRVGREHDRPVHGTDRRGGWEVTEHVVLTPVEARDLIDRLTATVAADEDAEPRPSPVCDCGATRADECSEWGARLAGMDTGALMEQADNGCGAAARIVNERLAPEARS